MNLFIISGILFIVAGILNLRDKNEISPERYKKRKIASILWFLAGIIFITGAFLDVFYFNLQ